MLCERMLLYLNPYEMAKFVLRSTPKNVCVALEHLSHVAMLENRLSEAVDFLKRLLQI